MTSAPGPRSLTPGPLLPPVPLLAALGDAGALDRAARCVEAGCNPADIAKATRVLSALELRTLVSCGRFLVAQWLGFRAPTLGAAVNAAAKYFVGENWPPHHEPHRPHPVVARGLRLYVYANNCPVSLSVCWFDRYGFEIDARNPDPNDWVPARERQRRLEECGGNLVQAEIVAGVRDIEGRLYPQYCAASGARVAVGGVA